MLHAEVGLGQIGEAPASRRGLSQAGGTRQFCRRSIRYIQLMHCRSGNHACVHRAALSPDTLWARAQASEAVIGCDPLLRNKGDHVAGHRLVNAVSMSVVTTRRSIAAVRTKP